MRTNDEIVTIIESKMNEMEMSMSELARRVGMAKSAVSRYFNRTREFPLNRVNDFSEVLHLNPAYVLGFEEKAKEAKIVEIYNQLEKPRQEKVFNFATNELDQQNKVIRLSEYMEEGLYGYASAGTGQQVFDNPVETIRLHKSDIPLQPYDLILQVVGDSMEPAFKDGEYIFIKKTDSLRNGQFGVFIINGESYLKKVYVEEDHLRLVSLNDKYEDLIFTEGDGITLVGQVVL